MTGRSEKHRTRMNTLDGVNRTRADEQTRQGGARCRPRAGRNNADAPQDRPPAEQAAPLPWWTYLQ